MTMVYFYLIELRTILSHENFLCIINLPCKKVGYVLPPPTHLQLLCFNPIIWKQNRTGVIMMRIIWTMMKMKWNEDNTKVMMIWMMIKTRMKMKITLRWEMRACVRLTREIFAQVNIMPSPQILRLFEDV